MSVTTMASVEAITLAVGQPATAPDGFAWQAHRGEPEGDVR